MPEGDTVWQAARQLHEALAGRVLARAELRVPRFATAELRGRRVEEVVARGKHLLARLGGGVSLHSHLGMDGAWRVYGAGERWRGGPGHQIRAVLGTAGHTAVGYRLPVVELLRTAHEDRAVGHLGPDLLGPDWDAAEALRRLVAEPRRPVGATLLDQRTMAGVGNVFMAEVCFLAGVTPWLPVGEVPAPEELVATAKRLLEANRERPARVTTQPAAGAAGAGGVPGAAGTPGRPGRTRGGGLYVYGRAGRPCLVCGAPISVASASHGTPGHQRPTYWCPRCQRGPVGPVTPPG